MGIPDYLICLLTNMHAINETTIRTEHGTMDWFKIGKGKHQVCTSSPCLFNFYAEYIMRNFGLIETQIGIKIAGRNINNLRYADDTTLMAESEEKLESLDESESGEWKSWLKTLKLMPSGPITSWRNRWGNNGNSERFYFLGLQNHCRRWLQTWN